jgi:hypothetical protein
MEHFTPRNRFERLLATFMDYMIRRGSHRKIARDGEEYMERFYLVKTPAKRALFLHLFLASDIDDVHCHPWPWGRLILFGWYREWYHDGTYKDCGPGSFVIRGARELHRVELLHGPVLTLFGHGKRCRTWGFMVRGKWLQFKEQENKTGKPARTIGWLLPKVLAKVTV